VNALSEASWHAPKDARQMAVARALLIEIVLKRISHVLALALALGTAACSPPQTQAAEQALATWRNKRPPRYTYVLEPIGWSNPGDTLRIKVESEEVLEAVERDGNEPNDRRYSMTGLLEEALEASDEATFSGNYDPELGYVKSFFYAPGPDEEPGAYGYEVLCFEPTLDERACGDVFVMNASPLGD
jgi:hypothetical protein